MKSKQRLGQRRTLFIFLMLLPSMLLPLVFTYYPLVKGGIMAFQNYTLMNIKNVSWCGLDNFKAILSNSAGVDFGQIAWNTVKWVLISLTLQFTMGFALSLMLKKKFAGAGVYQGLVFFPYAVSGFLIGIMWRWMFNGSNGVINDLLMNMGLIELNIGWLAQKETALLSCVIANVWYGIPFFTIMITAALRGVAPELYEAADMDGANKIQQFFNVTVPSIKSVLLMTVLMRVIWIFNFPDLIYSMTSGGPANSSQIITSYMMTLVYSMDYGKASAVGLMVIAFLAIFCLIYMAVTNYTSED